MLIPWGGHCSWRGAHIHLSLYGSTQTPRTSSGVRANALPTPAAHPFRNYKGLWPRRFLLYLSPHFPEPVQCGAGKTRARGTRNGEVGRAGQASPGLRRARSSGWLVISAGSARPRRPLPARHSCAPDATAPSRAPRPRAPPITLHRGWASRPGGPAGEWGRACRQNRSLRSECFPSCSLFFPDLFVTVSRRPGLVLVSGFSFLRMEEGKGDQCDPRDSLSTTKM